ncbi:uncharacterized protein LOC135369255 [Ornithodoros turicata]|uniref:uncharacterized protein LOC135369255 n=1 Tax=Ornithodoros turicata TaxID=34597 RepID=UPI00313931BB
MDFFIVLLCWCKRLAKFDTQCSATGIPPEVKPGNEEGFLLVFETSYLQSNCRLKVQLHGTNGVSDIYTVRDPKCNPEFLAPGSYNGLIITTPSTLGQIKFLRLMREGPTQHSWYLKKVDLFFKGKNKKLLFEVDNWLTFQDQDHEDVFPLEMSQRKVFKIMFGLNFPRYV